MDLSKGRLEARTLRLIEFRHFRLRFSPMARSPSLRRRKLWFGFEVLQERRRRASKLVVRPVAAGLGRPASTVRDWLSRFASRAELVREVFTVWLCALDADPPPLAPAGSVVADAVAAVAAAAAAAAGRWAGRLVSLSPGELASSVSAGRLLSPSWVPELGNTSPG